MKRLFNPKSVAVVGVSTNSSKVGHVIFSNLIKNGYDGKVFAINPKHKTILGKECYPSLRAIPKVDVAIIAVPAKFVPNVLLDGIKNNIKNYIIISGGFGESNNTELTNKLMNIINTYKINVLGPNCIGILNTKNKFDTVFFPLHKMDRPPFGKISIISQSGGIATAIIDKAANLGIGLSKVISYGNAYNINETDLLNYLKNDDETNVIVMYLESVKDGRRFTKILKETNKKKPIIILKAGKETKGKEAAKTHTGSMSSDYIAFKASFKTSGVLEANNLTDLFNYIKIFSQPLPKGKNLGIITNGGGLGVMATDEAIKHKLNIPELNKEDIDMLKPFIPSYVTIANPFDLVADADVDRYKRALDVFMNAKNIDMVLINVLFQAPSISEQLLNPIIESSANRNKPIAVVIPGGRWSEAFATILSMNNVPTYDSPEQAIKSLRKLYEYARFKRLNKR